MADQFWPREYRAHRAVVRVCWPRLLRDMWCPKGLPFVSVISNCFGAVPDPLGCLCMYALYVDVQGTGMTGPLFERVPDAAAGC
jgi:hypothetical protein